MRTGISDTARFLGLPGTQGEPFSQSSLFYTQRCNIREYNARRRHGGGTYQPEPLQQRAPPPRRAPVCLLPPEALLGALQHAGTEA